MNQGFAASDVLAVTRATLAYDQNEDRISLTCAFEKEECVVLWLTARLATQLVPHLCQMVAQLTGATPINSDRDVMIDEGALASAEGLESDTATSAVSSQDQTPEAPVVAGVGSVAWVVTEIDLTNGPMLVQLGFRDGLGHPQVLLSVEHAQLAQWSEGLRRCYAQAGWSMDCWQMPVGAGPQSHATRRLTLH